MGLETSRISKDYPSRNKRESTRIVSPRNKNNAEQPSNTTGEGTIVTNSTKVIASTTSTATIPSTAQSGRIFYPSITQNHPTNPGPTVASDFRPYMSSFKIPMNGQEQLYGMLTLV